MSCAQVSSQRTTCQKTPAWAIELQNFSKRFIEWISAIIDADGTLAEKGKCANQWILHRDGGLSPEEVKKGQLRLSEALPTFEFREIEVSVHILVEHLWLIPNSPL